MTGLKRIGDAAEQFVADRLVAAGWEIVGRNVRVGRGELDIVALDPGPPSELVVVEVRWRARRDYGFAEETFDHRKRGRLRRAAQRLVSDGRLPDGTPLPNGGLRVDLVVVEPGESPVATYRIRHHRAALGEA